MCDNMINMQGGKILFTSILHRDRKKTAPLNKML